LSSSISVITHIKSTSKGSKFVLIFDNYFSENYCILERKVIKLHTV